jgi:dihydroorotate dehydrogenase (NAD+) catalytic subunit
MGGTRAPDISVELCGLRLANPTVLASGVLGVSRDMIARVAACGAGAAVIKSISPQPREGHHNPTVIAYEAGMLNAVGYSNPGADEAAREFHDMAGLPMPVFASAVGRDAAEFAEVSSKLGSCGFSALEIPLSCPHTPGYGTLAGHGTPQATEQITRAVREVTDLPLFVKLSPNVPGIGELALAALEGGADGISAVNTLGPGMVINVEAREPVLDFRVGGVSGPALRPVAVRCVYDVATALRKAGKAAPIIGIGGVASGRDALEMIMAGASAVGVGTAVYSRGIGVFADIARELSELCGRLGIGSLEDARGAALEGEGAR